MNIDNQIRQWANLVIESIEDKGKMLETVIDDIMKNGRYDEWKIEKDANWRRGLEIAKTMTKDEIDSFLLDYSNMLYDGVKNEIVSAEDSDIETYNRQTRKMIGEAWRKMWLLWSWFHPFLSKNNLMDKENVHSGFGAHWLLDYVESIGGHSFEDFDKIAKSVRIDLPKAKTV